MRGGSHSSYRPDPGKQEAARDLIAQHRDYDTIELATFIDPELVAYIDDYQVGTLDLRGCELPEDIDENIAACLRNNTTIYSDELESLLESDPSLARLLKAPQGETRSEAIRARRSVFVLALLALANAPPAPDTNGQPADVA